MILKTPMSDDFGYIRKKYWSNSYILLTSESMFLYSKKLWELQTLRRGSPGGLSAPSVGNVRPTQPLHSRPLRTNIPPHPQVCVKIPVCLQPRTNTKQKCTCVLALGYEH